MAYHSGNAQYLLPKAQTINTINEFIADLNQRNQMSNDVGTGPGVSNADL
jgi:hypothetical protein